MKSEKRENKNGTSEKEKNLFWLTFTLGSFLCCPEGYENPSVNQIGDLSTCKNLNECALKTLCPPDTFCLDLQGSYNCSDCNDNGIVTKRRNPDR